MMDIAEHCLNVLWFIWIPYWCADGEVNGSVNIYMNPN